MNRICTRGLALAFVLVLGACGDDPTDIVEGDALTEAEAAALAEVVAGTLFATSEQTQAVPAPAAAPARASGNVEVDADVPCEFGGSVAVSGNLAFNVDDETGDGTLTYEVTTTHDDCGVESEEGIAFVLNGSPNLSAAFTFVSEGDAISFTGGYDGAIAWATDEKSGRCSIDVDFTLTGSIVGETGSATLNGRVCGITFSQSLDLT